MVFGWFVICDEDDRSVDEMRMMVQLRIVIVFIMMVLSKRVVLLDYI